MTQGNAIIEVLFALPNHTGLVPVTPLGEIMVYIENGVQFLLNSINSTKSGNELKHELSSI